MEQGELSQTSNELNDHLTKADAATVATKYNNLSLFARQVARLVAEAMPQKVQPS
jgi:hypothetical protein